jgi:3-isopropylmalate/(R)-2-methylmalate dehydratase large subunit
VTIKGEDIAPVVTWGTSPEDVLPITGVVPAPEDFEGGKVSAAKRSLDYMGLKPGTPLNRDRDRHGLHRLLHQRPDRGSARRRRDPEGQAPASSRPWRTMRAMVVPGSGLVRAQAEEEGLADIFKEAGFEWRLRAARCALR